MASCMRTFLNLWLVAQYGVCGMFSLILLKVWHEIHTYQFLRWKFCWISTIFNFWVPWTDDALHAQKMCHAFGFILEQFLHTFFFKWCVFLCLNLNKNIADISICRSAVWFGSSVWKTQVQTLLWITAAVFLWLGDECNKKHKTKTQNIICLIII